MEQIRVNPAIEENQRARLTKMREKRDSVRVRELLTHLENAAKGNENLVPISLECVENHVTLGEICNTLRGVWGEYRAESF